MLSLPQSLYLPLDDLLYITRPYINPDVSRSGIARLLKREGMARLENVIPKAEGETISAKKTFKDYEPGFVHVDIKYLPQMPDETSRRYLFVAIDRATRWVFLHIYGDMTDKSSVDFLRRLKLASPIKIIKLLTDNGSQFTDRFTTTDRKPSGRHAFDKVCAAMGIEHRLAPPRHPQMNGMVERFNGRISQLLQQTRFDSRAGLEATLLTYLKLYNHHVPQRAIGARTPTQALKEWQQKKPDLFVKRGYDQTGLDNQTVSRNSENSMSIKVGITMSSAKSGCSKSRICCFVAILRIHIHSKRYRSWCSYLLFENFQDKLNGTGYCVLRRARQESDVGTSEGAVFCAASESAKAFYIQMWRSEVPGNTDAVGFSGTLRSRGCARREETVAVF